MAQYQTPLNAGLSFKSNSGTGEFSGYASYWGIKDAYGDVVMPGAFQSIPDVLRVPMLWQHDQTEPCGKWLEIREDQTGLFVRGQLNLQTEIGQRVYQHLLSQDISGLSIGYTIPAGGIEVIGDVRYLKQVELAEISIVSLPANSESRILSVKFNQGNKPKTIREFETLLRNVGYAGREARAIASKGFAYRDDQSIEFNDDSQDAQIAANIQKLSALF